MSGSGKERELASFLTGTEKKVDKMTKTVDEYVENIYRMVLDKPFLTIRGGGSLGIDVTAIRKNMSFPMEVKSFRKKTLNFSSYTDYMEQYEEYKRLSEIYQQPIYYAFRTKGIRGEKWEFYVLDTEPAKNIKIPNIPKTTHGNPQLKWGEGMIMSEALLYFYGMIG